MNVLDMNIQFSVIDLMYMKAASEPADIITEPCDPEICVSIGVKQL